MKHDTLLHPEKSPVIQAFGSLAAVRLRLTEQVRHRNVAVLNRLPDADDAEFTPCRSTRFPLERRIP